MNRNKKKYADKEKKKKREKRKGKRRRNNDIFISRYQDFIGLEVNKKRKAQVLESLFDYLRQVDF